MSGVRLTQFSTVDLGILLPLGRQGLDRSLSEAADAAGLDPPLHHMLCVAAMKEKDLRANADSVKPYLNLFHAGFIVVSDERDFAEIFELAGMPSLLTETTERGICMAFMAGNLSQWRDAILRGCQKDVGRDARRIYNLIYGEFKKLGLTSIFEADQKQARDGQTFYLEHKK
jgi:hypothetical protein